jgi:hypothetical protein
MPDYKKNGKIYKLWSPEGDDIYIGSTVNSLAKRKTVHKQNYNNDRGCSSKILFQKYDDVRIELIEKFACENRMELNAREGYYIRTLDCVNKVISGRTPKEFSKQWREANREKLKEYYKEYSKKYYQKNKEKIKEYSEDNREKIKEYKKQYHEKNKEYLNQKRKERHAKKKNLVSVQCPVLSPEQSVE